MDPEKKYEPNLDPNKVKWGLQKQGHLTPVAWRAHVVGKDVLYPPLCHASEHLFLDSESPQPCYFLFYLSALKKLNFLWW